MPKRHWFRFSLRTLFWLTFAVAVALLAFREHRAKLEAERIARQRDPRILHSFKDFNKFRHYQPPGNPAPH